MLFQEYGLWVRFHSHFLFKPLIAKISASNKTLQVYNISIQDGSVSAPFTGTLYRVKYFKPIPKEIDQDTSIV